MVDDREILETLTDIYKVNVRRAGATLDPVALCCWGSRLFLGKRLGDRLLMELAVREFVDAHPESEENRRALIRESIPQPETSGADTQEAISSLPRQRMEELLAAERFMLDQQAKRSAAGLKSAKVRRAKAKAKRAAAKTATLKEPAIASVAGAVKRGERSKRGKRK
jgi:hypothetical protein